MVKTGTMCRASMLQHGIILLFMFYMCDAGWPRETRPSYRPKPLNPYSDYSHGPSSGFNVREASPRRSGYSSQSFDNYGEGTGHGYSNPNNHGNNYSGQRPKPRLQPHSISYSRPKSNSYVDNYEINKNRNSYQFTPAYSRGPQSYSQHGSSHQKPSHPRPRYPTRRPMEPSYHRQSYPKPNIQRPSYPGSSHRSSNNPRSSYHSSDHLRSSYNTPINPKPAVNRYPRYRGLTPSIPNPSKPSPSYHSQSHPRRNNHYPSRPKPSFSKQPVNMPSSRSNPTYSNPSRHFSLRPRRPSFRRSSSHRRKPSTRRSSSHKRPTSVSLPRPRTKNGFYQMQYKPRQKNNFYELKYPQIPKYDFSYSQDTSGYASQRKQKVACYQCNYREGKPHWEIVKVKKSVPDPYNPFRYMSVETDEYVKKQNVAGGWEKCQGNITPRTAKMNGIYSQASCDGNCYIRTEKNGMVYRGCYAGEWAVNQFMYGCSYQAGALYCFCRGDRCNGFMAPASFSQPYPHGYGTRNDVPFPSDYADTTRYNPYPTLTTFHQQRPMRSRRPHQPRPRRHRRSADNQTLDEQDVNEAVMLALMMTADRPEDQGKAVPSGKTDPFKTMRKCYQCSYHPGAKIEGCRGPFTKVEAGQLRVSSDECFGNCFVQITSNNEVIRGCYTGETGINQHIVGCQIQNNSTYCFCRGDSCNRFAVTIEEAEVVVLEEEGEEEEMVEEEGEKGEVEAEEEHDSERKGEGKVEVIDSAGSRTEDNGEDPASDAPTDQLTTNFNHEEDAEVGEEGDYLDGSIMLYYVQFSESE